MATRDSSFEGTNTSTTTANPLTSFGIWVAVRVRPFNKMELGDKDVEAPQPVIEMESDHKTLTLLDPTANYRERSTFTFDYCFSPFAPSIVLGDTARTTKDDSSDDEEASAERTQAEIYQAMGSPIVDSAWQGYNSCIFAYGQTSSGKSYTMMGTKRDPGIIPRLCRDLFERVETDRTNSNSEPGRKMIKVSLSYMEIYNERVKDLLKPKPKDARRQYKSRFETAAIDDDYQALRVRQHPLQGPFVEGLIRVDVENWLECVKYIRQGNELRSQCATDMNDSSSRSHAIFQLVVTQTEALGAKVRGKEVVNHKISKINLVDLAGSERITKTNVTGKHITEANHINQSLSTLRKVIDALVAKKKAGQTVIVPYRESLLTWILADNFGGNSKTAMIANVSPHHGNFLESESTLRYATLAKGIVNRARVNEDPSAKLIRELQAQLRQLQVELGKGAHEGHVRDLEDQMEENKKAMEELLAREEGMRVLIQESREREEQLRVEKETLERDQRHWRTEAERLRREKEELSAQLQRIVANDPTAATTTTTAPASTVPTLTKSGSRSVLKKSNTNFWMEGDGGDANPESTDAPTDDASSCPPHQSQLIKRRRSTSKLTAQDAQLPDFLMSDSVIKPTTGEGDDKAKADDAKSDDATSAKNSTIQPKKRANRAPPPWVVEDAPLASEPAKPSDAAVAPAPAEPTTVSTPTPEVRHGRRAATEQGERDRSTVHESTEQVRTAGAGRRRGGEVVNISLSNSPTPGQVPPSLAHLVAPTTTASPAIAKQPAGPDALDSFLNGSTAPVQRERGKPWKQRRTPSQTSSPAVL